MKQNSLQTRENWAGISFCICLFGGVLPHVVLVGLVALVCRRVLLSFWLWCSLFPLLGARVGSPLFVAGLASILFRHVLRPRYFWRVLFILVFGRA